MVRIWLRQEDGEIVVAGAARTGRGASLHARPGCLEKGLRPDVLARVTVADAAELLQRITVASGRKR